MRDSIKLQAKSFFIELQSQICSALERLDEKEIFSEDSWEREDHHGFSGGGGLTKLLRRGKVFEQAGVNFSEVYGTLPVEMVQKLLGEKQEKPFYATGTSLVIHPYSPKIPTTHANFRYLEVGDTCWLGGGADLTPYVLYREDAKHFHNVLKNACDTCNADFYPKFKKECDTYFYISHRKETRGVGGIFFDYLGKHDPENIHSYFEFSKSAGASFIEAYVPIVEKRKSENWSEREKEFQLLRRGRYVEFNLVYDRGTQFGLHTNGRAESILMSLPPLVTWQYEGSLARTEAEIELEQILKHPIDWV